MTQENISKKSLTDNERFELILDSRTLYKRLEEIDTVVKRIELALIGNEALGQTGLVERINILEREVQAHKHKLISWGGVIVGIVFAVQFILNLISKIGQ
jgi:hypothetical protein